MTDVLATRIDQLESRFALQDLVSDYCFGFDKRDWDRFLAIWWEDCVWEVGPPFGNFDGHAGIERAVKETLWARWRESTHYTTNLRVSFDGPDSAHGVCDVYCVGTTADGLARSVAATYRDRFERRGGVWKIARRGVTMQHFSELVGITFSPPVYAD